MIPRYSRPEMAAIFAPETELGIWLDVELAAAEAMAAIGAIPAEPVRALVARPRSAARPADRPARVEEIEATTRHDVIAFLTHVEQVCGEEAGSCIWASPRPTCSTPRWRSSSTVRPT